MGKRAFMLASVVREIIAPALRECPSDCGIVTITDVEITSDESYATVHISSLHHPELALQFFERERNHLQHALGKLERKRVPLLRFRLDGRSERGSAIERLLGGEG